MEGGVFLEKMDRAASCPRACRAGHPVRKAYHGGRPETSAGQTKSKRLLFHSGNHAPRSGLILPRRHGRQSLQRHIDTIKPEAAMKKFAVVCLFLCLSLCCTACRGASFVPGGGTKTPFPTDSQAAAQTPAASCEEASGVQWDRKPNRRRYACRRPFPAPNG